MEQVVDFGGKVRGAGGDDIFDGYTMAIEVWGKACEDRDSGLKAFAYLWRRFGPPWHGSDDHKDLCTYCLTTADPDVFLVLHLNGAGLKYSVSYMAHESIREEYEKPMQEWEKKFENWFMDQHQEIKWENHEKWGEKYKKKIGTMFWTARYDGKIYKQAVEAIGKFPRLHVQLDGWRNIGGIVQRVNQSIFDAMNELLRPVYIRDCPINIFGMCEEAEIEDGDENLEPGVMYAAKRSMYAGFGVPKESLDKLIKGEK